MCNSFTASFVHACSRPSSRVGSGKKLVCWPATLRVGRNVGERLHQDVRVQRFDVLVW